MTEKHQSKRVAKLELKIPIPGEKKKEKLEFGGIFTSPYQGNYGVSLTLQTGEKDPETGYPVRDRVVAIKTESGRKLDISEVFCNLIVYEDMEARPPYDPENF